MKYTLPVELHAVTVYSDRAELSYEGTISLPVGSHTLVVQGERGWEQLDSNTVQVNVEDAEELPITLRNVGFASHVVTEDIRDEVRKLTAQLKEIIKQIKEVEDNINVQQQSNVMIHDLQKLLIESHINSNNETTVMNGEKETHAVQEYLLDVARWDDMANFIASSTRTHKAQIDKLERNKEELIKKRRRLEEALNIGYDMPLSHIPTQRVRTEHVIEIAVQVDEMENNTTPNESAEHSTNATEQTLSVKFYISFVVHGARWEPLYDLRVNTSQMTLEVNYYANVFQSTNLDWHKVRLRLSTATPHFSTTPPSFDGRWEISLRPPAPPPRPIHHMFMCNAMALGARSCKMKRSMPTDNAVMMSADDSTDGANRSAALPFAAPMAPTMEMATLDEDAENNNNQGNKLSSSSMTSVFAVAGLQSIKSDNKAVKVTIMRKMFPVKLRYLTTPKRDPLVYVMARARNTTSFDLLPGLTSVFYDNTFVNTSRMSLVPPRATIDVSLGADDGIQVTRKLVRRVENTSRVFFTVKRYVEYSYTFDVESKLSHRAVELVLRDQYPYSVDNELNIELLEPTKAQIQTLPAEEMEEQEQQEGEGEGNDVNTNLIAQQDRNIRPLTLHKDEATSATDLPSSSSSLKITTDDVGRVEWKMQLAPLTKRTVRLSFRATYPNEKEVYGLDDNVQILEY